MRRVRVVKPHELSREHLAAWREYRRADSTLDSPYFSVEYVQSVGAVRDDVRVAILEEADVPVGFFAFQRGRWNIGKPVGGKLADFQGAILRQGIEWDAASLVRACGLAAWDFDHLLGTQQMFGPHQRSYGDSPYLDLSRGFEAYRQAREAAGSMAIAKIQKQVRKLEKDLGPVRFELQCRDRTVFEALLTWKSRQYVRTGRTNLFALPWVTDLLLRLWCVEEESLTGCLSTLWIGDELAAVHFGMCSATVCHYWFPSYSPAFEKHSPGLILLTELAAAVAAAGITRLDLGLGDEAYKQRFLSSTTRLIGGSVECQPLTRAIRRTWRRIKKVVRTSPLGDLAEMSVRRIQRMCERSAAHKALVTDPPWHRRDPPSHPSPCTEKLAGGSSSPDLSLSDTSPGRGSP